MLSSFSVAIIDTSRILAYDTFSGLLGFVHCKPFNIQSTNNGQSNFLGTAVAFLNDNWYPKISKQVYQHVIACINVLALTGSKICEMVNQIGYRKITTNTNFAAETPELWDIIHSLFRLMIFSKLWLERIQACHAYVQNKASSALLWKDKFEMQLFTLCKAHQKYIINVNRDTVKTHYDENFVALVSYVVLWRGTVSKTVENIVHRPALKKRRGGKLRSRNVYVDEHLRNENGKDTYADLEDFIVGDDDDVD